MCFHQPQPAAIEQIRHQPARAVKLSQHRTHFDSAENHRKPLRSRCSGDVLKPRQVDVAATPRRSTASLDFREGVMYREIGLAIAGALLVACADVRVGMQRSPIGAVNSDEAVLQAVRHTLPPGEQNCQLELVTGEDAQRASENTAKQVVSVKICGRSQEFSIQRSHVDADSVLIIAKKI
jgi:hypothetical protein